MPSQLLTAYRWPGNVRQLRNLVEQMSVIEQTRDVDSRTLRHYLPEESSGLCQCRGILQCAGSLDSINERELIFKFLFDMKNDLNALKEQVPPLAQVNPCPRTSNQRSVMS
jgi:DNA-binding NtrC family response regulator